MKAQTPGAVATLFDLAQLVETERITIRDLQTAFEAWPRDELQRIAIVLGMANIAVKASLSPKAKS